MHCLTMVWHSDTGLDSRLSGVTSVAGSTDGCSVDAINWAQWMSAGSTMSCSRKL
jgi:hypothetical protein